MSTSDYQTPVAVPSATPLNAASLLRMAGAILAGYLAKTGLVDGDQANLIAAGVLAVVVAAWHFWKNRSVTKTLATAMATPAQKVVTPAGERVPPAVVSILALLFLCAAISPWLGGCALPQTAGLTPSLSPAGQLAAAKLEFTAETAFNLAGNAYEAAKPYLSEEQKTTVQGYIATAYQALLAARSAETLGDTATIQAKIDAIQGLAASVTAITAPVTPRSQLAPLLQRYLTELASDAIPFTGRAYIAAAPIYDRLAA